MLGGARGRGGRIRAPRRGLTKDEVDFDTTWGVLDRAFREIHSRNSSSLSFEELYRNAYKLVLKKKGDMLYNKVKELETELLENNVKARMASIVTPSLMVSGTASAENSVQRQANGEKFMRSLKEAFEEHQLSMGMITNVLMYMDRIHTTDHQRPSIYASSMALFRDCVLKAKFDQDVSCDMLGLLEIIILEMIRLERLGEMIDRPLVRACSRMLEALYETASEEESSKLYLTSFEPKFLDSSSHFYREEGKQLLAEADAPTFCKKAQLRLKEENERCQQSLSPITDAKIKSVVEEELIRKHIREVINLEGTGVRNMLDNDKIEDLRNVYDLVARVDVRLNALKDAVQKRVVELGNEINSSASVIASERPLKPLAKPEKGEGEKAQPERQLNQQTLAAISWVENVLKLKEKYDRLWEQAFRGNNVMTKALEISFQDFINANARSPEFLSLFLDENLKRGPKGKTESEMDAMLDSGVNLLQYVMDKDMLENYYHKHMAKRLLHNKSISRDMERQMISKLKSRLGNQFTTKGEGMLRDMDLSDNMNTQYKEHVAKLGDPDPLRIEMESRILTANVWPFNNPSDGTSFCHYPVVVERVKQKYEKFYLDKHTGRKVTWLAHMGEATIRASFSGSGKSRRYEVTVPTYCMIILLLFNDLNAGASLTFEEIQAETNIPQDQLIRNLQSLSVAPKTRLLKKEPMSRDVNLNDRFSVNEEFTSQFLRIKVALVSDTSNRVETAEQRKETKKKADEERGHMIDAAIVRIMKARKHATHQQLMTETLQQLSSRFQPDVNMIKRKIESLIDREYLERGSDPANPSYNYLA